LALLNCRKTLTNLGSKSSATARLLLRPMGLSTCGPNSKSSMNSTHPAQVGLSRRWIQTTPTPCWNLTRRSIKASAFTSRPTISCSEYRENLYHNCTIEGQHYRWPFVFVCYPITTLGPDLVG